MKSMNFTVGLLGPYANVTIVNKQNHVEYSFQNGYASESDVRRAAGNYGRHMYQFDFSGHYSDRGEAVVRLKSEIEKTKEKLEALEFALKVTKKKTWILGSK